MDENLITQSTKILLETGTNELEILEFFIDEDVPGEAEPNRVYFGLNVAKVMQVIEAPEIRDRQHDRHPSFLGVTQLREHALPLVDLGVWLGMRRKPSKYDVVIVTEFSQAVTGFLISGVTEIHRVGWDEVSAPEGYLGRVAIGSLIGTVQKDDRIVQLLDLESVLADLDPSSSGIFSLPNVKSPKPYKVLVADDSPTIRRMIETNLRAANLVPEVVGDGRTAWERLSGYKSRCGSENLPLNTFVDMLISDIEMPQMDGFALAKRVKSDDLLRKLPVILYSSIITDELRHKGVSVGADEQISKPEFGHMAERAIALLEGKRG